MVISVIVGTLLGFLSGLGTGGGSLLILWLTLGLGWMNEAARLANLAFSLLAKSIDPWWIKKLFGVLLLFTGFRELFYREQKRK